MQYRPYHFDRTIKNKVTVDARLLTFDNNIEVTQIALESISKVSLTEETKIARVFGYSLLLLMSTIITIEYFIFGALLMALSIFKILSSRYVYLNIKASETSLTLVAPSFEIHKFEELRNSILNAKKYDIDKRDLGLYFDKKEEAVRKTDNMTF